MAENGPARAAPVQLPIINISEATPAVGKAMIDAATKYGFFYVDSASSYFSNDDVESAFDMVCPFLSTVACVGSSLHEYQNSDLPSNLLCVGYTI